MKSLFLILLGAASAIAQPVSFGVKAGVPLTDFFSTVESKNFGFNSNTKRYIAGVTLEARLPFGLGVEFDALYHPLNYSGSAAGSTETVTAHGFEFPLLAKYRFPSKVVAPFIDAGFAFTSLSGLKETVTNVAGITTPSATTKIPIGFVLGGGLDIHALIIHITPEVRYTHWGSAAFVDPLSLVKGSQNQAEVLLGITF
jgi:hypothetical protein